MRTANATLPDKLPETYAELVAAFPPRPIHDDNDYENTIEVVGRLAGFELNADQEDYLEALSVFVEAYEQASYAGQFGELSGIEALRFLLKENNMNASDLGRLLGSRQLGSAILRNERSLSKAHIAKLAERFRVSPAVFLD